jgi:hypothetical protein
MIRRIVWLVRPLAASLTALHSRCLLHQAQLSAQRVDSHRACRRVRQQGGGLSASSRAADLSPPSASDPDTIPPSKPMAHTKTTPQRPNSRPDSGEDV